MLQRKYSHKNIILPVLVRDGTLKLVFSYFLCIKILLWFATNFIFSENIKNIFIFHKAYIGLTLKEQKNVDKNYLK